MPFFSCKKTDIRKRSLIWFAQRHFSDIPIIFFKFNVGESEYIVYQSGGDGIVRFIGRDSEGVESPFYIICSTVSSLNGYTPLTILEQYYIAIRHLLECGVSLHNISSYVGSLTPPILLSLKNLRQYGLFIEHFFRPAAVFERNEFSLAHANVLRILLQCGFSVENAIRKIWVKTRDQLNDIAALEKNTRTFVGEAERQAHRQYKENPSVIHQGIFRLPRELRVEIISWTSSRFLSPSESAMIIENSIRKPVIPAVSNRM